MVTLRLGTPEAHFINYLLCFHDFFPWVNPYLNIKQENGKSVIQVTSCIEISKVTFILVCSYEEVFCVNNLNLIKISLSELGGISEKW